MGKSFLIDTSRCTACRGCQVACKEWFELPANKTKQTGSHQNPPDLNPNNYKLVRFSEDLDNGVIRWHFFPDQCRHCLEPPCAQVAENYVEGAVFHGSETGGTGAVVYTAKTRQIPEEGFRNMRDACPYDIPRRDSATGLISKCSMCHERVSKGLNPVCVNICPTGCMNFGDRQDMLDLAQQRLALVKKGHPMAAVIDAGDVNTIYLLTDAPEKYHQYAVARFAPGMDRKAFLARLATPLRRSIRGLLTS